MADPVNLTRLTPGVPPTLEEVDMYVRRGRRLRAEAFSDFLLSLFSKTSVDRNAAQTNKPEVGDTHGATGKLRNSLAAIRSAAELLRDNPGVEAAERQRFINIVLMEEARLERLLSAGMKPAL